MINNNSTKTGYYTTIKNFVERCSWRWAKTYVTVPHEYIVRDKCELTDDEFVFFVITQREHGIHERWGKYNFPYLYIDGYKYWTMGDTIENTIIINRQKVFGEYDKIAYEYETLFKDEESIKQDLELVKLFPQGLIDMKVFDLGCGTGLFVDLTNIKPEKYRGIDPSKRMLEIFREKHTDFNRKVCRTSFEEDGDKYFGFDCVVALYGSCSYVMKPYVEKLAKRHRNLFLMFYKEDYNPVTYEKTGVSMHHFRYSKKWLAEIFNDCEIQEFYTYYIVKNF